MKTTNLKAQRINIFLVLKRHLKTILILGMLTFMVVAPILYLFQNKSYSAKVELRVDPVANSMTPGMDSANSVGDFYSEYVATQKFKILKLDNIKKALNMLDEPSLTSVVGTAPLNDMTVERLSKSIQVSPSSDSLILSLTVTGPKPQGLAEFINNLVNIYLDDLKADRDNQESTRIQYTDKQRKELQDQIEADEAQLKKISEETDTGNFTTEDIPYRNEMKVQADTALRAENDRLLKEKLYNEYVDQLPVLRKLDSNSKIDEKLRADTFYFEQRKSLQSKIDSINAQLSNPAEGTSTSQLNDSLTSLKKQLQDFDASSREKYRKQVEAEVDAAQEKQKMVLYSDYLVAKQYEDAIKKSFDSIKEKYSFVSRRILVAQQIQADLADLKSQMAKVNSNITYFQGEQQSGGFVAVENYAKTPVFPDKSKLAMNVAIGFILSFLWITLVVFIYEYIDTRIKSPEELKAYTGIKPSWPISHYNGSFINVSINANESNVNKAIGSLATRINQERQDYQSKVITFNGVGIQTGTTEILLNCAHNMKDNCEKILVIDLNRDRPGFASKLKIPRELQFSVKELTENSAELTVYKDFDRDIDILTLRDSGPLENKVFDRLLALAKNRYDIIFIDAAPILRSANTEHIFLKSDSVIFVVRGNVSKYPDLQHTLELAENFGVKSVGLVLNWWKLDNKGKKVQKRRSIQQAVDEPA